jgi:UDP-2,3-diacylglucosamine pyrophosphatase LpxH
MKKKFKKYRVIGDIHGRKNWIDLVTPFDDDTLYIFIGDYTDPYYYEGVTHKQMIEQILLMLQFKKEHPDNVILLVGNHDLQYIADIRETNRYDWLNAAQISKIFKENEELFYGVAYQIGEKYLVTHAGVTLDWYQKWIDYKKDDLTLERLCEQVNDLWHKNKEAFAFSKSAKMSDYYGSSSTHGPLWIRPTSLWEYNIFGFGSGKIQIVGHTRFEHYRDEFKDLDGTIVPTGTQKDEPTEEMIDRGLDYWINDGVHVCKPVYNDNNNVDIIQIDCLEAETACVEINGETLEWKKVLVENDKTAKDNG